MRLIMMGTGPFAVPTFQELYGSRHSVVALVTRPLRSHRGKDVVPVSPIRDIAHEHGTPIFDPEDINLPESRKWLAEYRSDLLIVCDYGQILLPETLATSRLGGINLHASLLPKYRGAAPINWALYYGEKETGVTVIHMSPKVDAGPCIAQVATPIRPDENAADLEVRLAQSGAWLVLRSVDALEEGRLQALPQNPALASRAPRLKKTDGIIDWTRPAAAIANQIRAMEPWPKTYTFWYHGDNPPVRMILGPAKVIATPTPQSPGTVLEAAGDRLVIAAGEGAVAPSAVQPAGKRLMPIAEFLRGHRVEPGHRFGPE
jgi:methionyl-tRNA formyltransferase